MEEQEKNETMPCTGKIDTWQKEPKRIKDTDNYTIGFKIEDQWHNTELCSLETLLALKNRFPVGTTVSFEKKQGKYQDVIIDTIKEEKPTEPSQEQPAAPKQTEQPKRDIDKVQDYQARRDYKDALKWWKKDRGILRQVFIKEAGAIVREQLQRESEALRQMSGDTMSERLKDAGEQIIQIAQAMDVEYDTQFPDAKKPEPLEKKQEG